MVEIEGIKFTLVIDERVPIGCFELCCGKATMAKATVLLLK